MWYVAYKPHTFSWFMWLINHNLHVKRLGDFGTFCLGLARASRELNLSRRCLTCFCLIRLAFVAYCYSNFEKWGTNCDLQCKPQSLICFAQISNFEALRARERRERQNFFCIFGISSWSTPYHPVYPIYLEYKVLQKFLIFTAYDNERTSADQR